MTPEEFDVHKRARFERMTVTQAEGSTELAKDRLRKLAGDILNEIMRSARKPLPECQDLVVGVLERACFDTFREGIILADQSVVEQLAVAIATIEELEKRLVDRNAECCDLHQELAPLKAQRDARVQVQLLDIVPETARLRRENDRLKRQVEDLANDRAAADAEAAKLRQQLEASRADAQLAHTAFDKRASDICQLQGQLWTQNGNVDRLNREVEGLRNDVRQAEAAYESVQEQLTECRRNRVGDSERIGAEMCRAEPADAEAARLRAQLQRANDVLKHAAATAVENARLRGVVAKFYALCEESRIYIGPELAKASGR